MTTCCVRSSRSNQCTHSAHDHTVHHSVSQLYTREDRRSKKVEQTRPRGPPATSGRAGPHPISARGPQTHRTDRLVAMARRSSLATSAAADLDVRKSVGSRTRKRPPSTTRTQAASHFTQKPHTTPHSSPQDRWPVEGGSQENQGPGCQSAVLEILQSPSLYLIQHYLSTQHATTSSLAIDCPLPWVFAE